MPDPKLYTLVFVQKKEQILLGFKKRGLGQGRWNGFGGKVEPGETIDEGALRELKEECGLIAKNLKYIGLLNFEFRKPELAMAVHVFKTSDFIGRAMESEEMRPQWFDIGDIPFACMWPDDKIWFPYMLEGKCFLGKFLFEDFDTMVQYEVYEKESMTKKVSDLKQQLSK